MIEQDMIATIMKIVNKNPYIPQGDNPTNCPCCYYCREQDCKEQKHKEDCPWLQLKNIMKENGYG